MRHDRNTANSDIGFAVSPPEPLRKYALEKFGGLQQCRANRCSFGNPVEQHEIVNGSVAYAASGIIAGPAPACVMKRAASWNRSNSYLAISACRQPNSTSAASNASDLL
jgi:hypothetical protein